MATVKAAIIESIIDSLKTVISRSEGRTGLCSQVTEDLWRKNVNEFDPAIQYWREHRRALFLDWADHSGEYDYPVPSIDTELNPIHAYNCCYEMFEGQYGKLRIELAKSTILSLQDILESCDDTHNV
jgi:hypothetical protein